MSFRLSVDSVYSKLTLGLPEFPGTSPDHPGISPAGRERYQKKSGISPPPLYPRPPDGDIPGRRGHPGPRRGYPRPLGDIPGRVGDVPDAPGTSPACGGGHPRPARGYPRPFGGCPARVLVPHSAHSSQPTHAIKNETRQGVKRCLCDTTRPSVLRGCGRRTRSPRARGRGEDQRATQRGEARRQAGRVALRPPCAAVARPL